MTKEALTLALEALELCNGSATVDGVVIYTDLEITAIKEALAQEKALQALHDENERLGLYKDAYAEPEEEKLHPVHIGVDVTREGTAVTAFYRKPDAVMEMFYSQFHPLAQPEKTVCPFCSSEWVTAEQHDRKMDRLEQEPVAITITGKLGNIYSFTGDYSLKKGDKVYTTPPQRTWVGLTNGEFIEACQMAERGNYLVAFQRIQAKLKEKNT